MSNTDLEYNERVRQNLALKTGDVVEILDCFEAGLFKEKQFEITDIPRKMFGRWYAKLQGVGFFDIGRLKKVS